MYELEIIINSKSFYKTIQADSLSDAINLAYDLYPCADDIDYA